MLSKLNFKKKLSFLKSSDKLRGIIANKVGLTQLAQAILTDHFTIANGYIVTNSQKLNKKHENVWTFQLLNQII